MNRVYRVDNVENYSGVNIQIIHRKIQLLKTKHYKILNFSVGGDAPKDFIQAYIYGDSKKANSTKWKKYIAKVGHKWYPLESITEHLLNRIGDTLGLRMAKSHLRLFDNQLRFMSLYFLNKNDELVHGANIYSAYLNESSNEFVQEIENEKLSREYFTFQFTIQAIQTVFPKHYETILSDFVNLLMFDAITGNNDRHFYNWGVVRDIRGVRKPVFSPIYDSARGLFWNYPERKIQRLFIEKNKIDTYQFDKYLNHSLPKTGWEGEIKINHFELLKNIYRSYPEYRNNCDSLISHTNLDKVLKMLNKEFCNFYSEKRIILIQECLKRRFLRLQQLCH